MINLLLRDSYQDQINQKLLIQAAETVMQHCKVVDSPDLTIRITDDSEMKDLNNRYRGINKTTDVLSFKADFTDPDLETRYLGDLVISYPQAKKQASMRGHHADQELQLLVIHGVLHLLDFVHQTKQEKKKMWSLQKQILEKLGISIQIEDPGEM